MIGAAPLVVTSVLLALSFTLSARAESLPKEAVALKPTEVKAIYSGKSSNWSETRAYFAPDGSVFLFKKDKTVWAEGRWTITDNQACMNVTWNEIRSGKTGNHTDCWTWFRHGKRHLALWSGQKDKKTGYWDGEIKLLRKGDVVTTAVAALKAGQ
ncbi:MULTISPECIES: DUF995 domain-containing protein [unclassified Shinella]|uniref:DUF995 domain-containing protein n=1 Tax=unclassified Shinella TaxID=2643062 RepID=UPI00225CB110|nr:MULTISPECIES: DUF995 domain-containing protein [unclassified Shinella]MCO5153637.1 DUF995 domain-containing protein [Shinella sp.]MDC7259894.1 DUF995 domain-containing protein [Shinella sp. YE25]CAI0341759.1 conserved exported hypothetical protein [Rhizobiaceae bacterium]CAK7262077.1 DUF995 domain-containing protein [Shinella sp. WSC3-e]